MLTLSQAELDAIIEAAVAADRAVFNEERRRLNREAARYSRAHDPGRRERDRAYATKRYHERIAGQPEALEQHSRRISQYVKNRRATDSEYDTLMRVKKREMQRAYRARKKSEQESIEEAS